MPNIHPGTGLRTITWDDAANLPATTEIDLHVSGQRLSDPDPHGWDGQQQLFRRNVGGGQWATYAFGGATGDVALVAYVNPSTGVSRTGKAEPHT